jgi:translation initiation factor 1 (eIF-1/SUI1)
MKMRASVICKYESNSVSKAIAAALRPDNLRAPRSIKISTRARGGKVLTTLEMDGRMETLLATLDDLLACTSTAESVL